MLTAGPSRTAGYAELAGAGCLAVLALLADDGGRVLLWPAAAVLLGLALRDLLLRPVLEADRAGLVVVQGLTRRSAPWATVDRVRVVTDRRAPLLELDLGETVVVLSRLRLGRPPALVLEELLTLRAEWVSRAEPPS